MNSISPATTEINETTPATPAVNHSLIYFFHIPKTAGTSLSLAMQEVYGTGAVTPQLLWDDWLVKGFRPGAQTRVIIGHFGGLLPFYLGQLPRMITLLRDPVARALSHINHVQRDVNHPLHELARPLSIIDYCRNDELRRTLDNFQTRYLASFAFARALFQKPENFEPGQHGRYSVQFERALLSMDAEYDLEQEAIRTMEAMTVFGLCEEQAKALKLFEKVLHWPRPARLLVANTRLDTQKKVEDLTFRERRWLRDVTKIDQRIYDWATSIFSHRYQAEIENNSKPNRTAA